MHIILWIGILTAWAALFIGAGRAIAGARFERGLQASTYERGALVPLRAVDSGQSHPSKSERRSA
jgi:hypothetical protein